MHGEVAALTRSLWLAAGDIGDTSTLSAGGCGKADEETTALASSVMA